MKKVISYHTSRVSIGMLAATGVAALGGLALQQLGGVGGLSSGVQGLLSQESSGPQIATRLKKINVHISRSILGRIYSYLIFVTDATDGVRVNFFWPV